MSLFGKKEKEEIVRLEEKVRTLLVANEELAAKIPDEVHTLDGIKRELSEAQELLEACKQKRCEVQKETTEAQQKLAALESLIIDKEEAVEIQSFGLYTPRYSFMHSDEYRTKLLEIRARQKEMITNKTAISANTSWTVSGSEAKGKKMIADMKKFC